MILSIATPPWSSCSSPPSARPDSPLLMIRRDVRTSGRSRGADAAAGVVLSNIFLKNQIFNRFSTRDC
jgi:hypothetical protein